jgi:hypothetical protein
MVTTLSEYGFGFTVAIGVTVQTLATKRAWATGGFFG